MGYPQTTTTDQGTAFAGLDGGGPHVTDPGISEEATAEVPHGVFVKQGTTEAGVLLLTAVNNYLAGATLHSHKHATPEQLGDTGVKPGKPLNIRKQGRMFVQVEETVVKGDPVFIRCIADGSEVAGACRKTADASDCVDASGWATWEQGGAAGDVAMLDFDIRNQGA